MASPVATSRGFDAEAGPVDRIDEAERIARGSTCLDCGRAYSDHAAYLTHDCRFGELPRHLHYPSLGVPASLLNATPRTIDQEPPFDAARFVRETFALVKQRAEQRRDEREGSVTR